ncbi:Aste57867_24549 [Aphanomyces stellatus]|uniref:Aste57867_24549 protein n=1 Tax=Aphanomyces stellatus TaxID=120398 RepID=A0A485LQR7_9STRA|nr:hypothetical protein As57867_024472 [Aphanomyces stellatus]VFU01188.1 Aste57867_24549 [Aphanomyces stellatus]
MNLLPSEINELYLCCQPSCFKKYHSRGIFADLNKKEVLVSPEDVFRDMDMQYEVAVNADVAAKHRAENLRKRGMNSTYDDPTEKKGRRDDIALPRGHSIDQVSLPSLRGADDKPTPTSYHPIAPRDATHLPAIRNVDNGGKVSSNVASILTDMRAAEESRQPLVESNSSVYLPPLQAYSKPPPLPAHIIARDEPMDHEEVARKTAYVQPWVQGDYVRSVDRFRSTRYAEMDERNNVFRVDLTPAFQNTVALSDAEVSFIFRCMESVDSLVVIQGLACRLTPSYWTIPFLLATLPANVPIHCERFHWDRAAGTMAFVGDHHVPLTYVKAYFLSGSTIRLTDESNRTVTVTPPEDGLALRDIALEFQARLLHSNLKQDFAWDLFAGGSNCWMQYMPAQYQDIARFQPKLHLCGSGQRSELIHTGHGSTDIAYQVVLGEMEFIVFDVLTPQQCVRVVDFLKRMGYQPNTRANLVEKYLHNLKKFGYRSSKVRVRAGEFVHIHKGRLHMWRSVVSDKPMDMYPTMMYLSWEWLFQGASPRGIQESAKYSLNLSRLVGPTSGFVFNPRNCILEAIRQWMALTNLEKCYDKCVLRLRALRSVLEMMVEEEQFIQNEGDDSWFIGETHITPQILNTLDPALPPELSRCAMCKNELSNSFKQCLGCSVFRTKTPFVICISCFRNDKQFSPQVGLRSSLAHTGCLPHSQTYKESPEAVQCTCAAKVRCPVCDGCDQCCCFCHTMFQTRYRLQRPDELVQLYHMLLSRTNKDTRRL